MKTKKKNRLLFVCLGNICRSPAAEAVMKSLVHDNDEDDAFFIDSAGIGNWHVGQLPDRRMISHGANRGYVLNSLARQFHKDDFDCFDYILVMDNENYRAITSMASNENEKGKVRMLTDYLQEYKGQPSVPDPYYGDGADFEYALDLIEDACRGLLMSFQ